MECIVCGSSNVHKDGIREGYQRYKCLDCGRRFKGEQVEKTIEYIINKENWLQQAYERKLLHTGQEIRL